MVWWMSYLIRCISTTNLIDLTFYSLRLSRLETDGQSRVHNRDNSCSQAQRLQATAFADWLISVGDGLLHDPENETVVLKTYFCPPVEEPSSSLLSLSIKT